MNRRLLTILTLAFLLAGGSSLLVYRMVGKKMTTVQKKATAKVVAAAADIKLGAILTANDLTTIEIAGTLPQGALLKQQDAIGRGVVSNLYKGETILESRLAQVGSGGGLAATIRKGMRACGVKVDEVVGVAGFVTPGMRVDVIISGNPPGPSQPVNGPEVRTLLQNIEVLSAGTDIQKDTEGKAHQVQVVNLLVSPEQAEALSLASTHTHVQLVLRNPMDTTTDKVAGTDLALLYGMTTKPAGNPLRATGKPKKPAPPMFSVVVYNGAQRTEQKFEARGEKQ